MTEKKQNWSFIESTTALADTGDYETVIQFTNEKDIFQTCGEELEADDIELFCKLLNKMPDLWSHSVDQLEFEKSSLAISNKELREENDELKAKLLGIAISEIPARDREAEELRDEITQLKEVNETCYQSNKMLEDKLAIAREGLQAAQNIFNRLSYDKNSVHISHSKKCEEALKRSL